MELLGVTSKVLSRMVQEKIVTPVQFPGCRAFYRRKDILAAAGYENEPSHCYA